MELCSPLLNMATASEPLSASTLLALNAPDMFSDCWCAVRLQAGNAADPLRYAFIVSQAQLVDAAQVASTSYNKTTDLENVGSVSVGVSRADGQKCSRRVRVP